MTAPARPLYFRLLGVKHLRAGPVAAFVLFEGSIAAGALLALADVVSWWGFIAIPVAVAVMVKIHDRVARALVQPLAVVQMSASRPLRDRRMIGRSAVPGPARLTTEIAGDDAVASPDAWPDRFGGDQTAIGTASVTSIGRAPVPGPGPSEGAAEGPPGPRSPSPEEQTGQSEQIGQDRQAEEEGQADGRFSMRAEGRAEGWMDRLDPESRARGNQGHFD